MAKRLTGTDKWNKAWFQELTLKQKCLWQYLCDNCDQAGFWEENFKQAKFQIGAEVKREDLQSLKDVVEFAPGLWLISDFVEFQYGCSREFLNVNNKAHLAVIRCFEKRECEAPTKGLGSPLEGAHNKDKDKDKDKDKSNKEARPRSVEDVRAYMLERMPNVPKAEASKFFDHFESNGWKVGGKAPMKDWRASVRTWLSRISVPMGTLPSAPRHQPAKPLNEITISCSMCGKDHKASEVCR